MRKDKIERNTKETQIKIKMNLDGKGISRIDTGLNFFNHMLENFTKHGMFDLEIKAKGDLEIDQHHTIEDIGIVLGQMFRKILSDGKGIKRSGSFAFPMDDSLGIVAIDIGGRPSVVFNVKFKRRNVGDLDTDLIEEFFKGFANGLSCNIAIYVPYGKDDHHKVEAVFKAFGKALKMACEVNPKGKNMTLSTKGLIDFMKA